MTRSLYKELICAWLIVALLASSLATTRFAEGKPVMGAVNTVTTLAALALAFMNWREMKRQ